MTDIAATPKRSLLQPLDTGTGYLKATLQGFPKSGKSYTATELATGTRALMEMDGPIAYFDTEGASGYLAAMVQERTGQSLVGVRSRSLNDATTFLRECEEGDVSVAIIDSVTHIWRDLTDSWLRDLNDQRKRRRKSILARLPMSAWLPLKQRWFEFMDLFLTSKLNVILCARVAFDYDIDETDEGTQEIRKSGVKISSEKDTGYESSLLVEMERVEQRSDGRFSPKGIIHRATVLGDRFHVIDGMSANDPTFEFFKPHVALLRPDTHAAVDPDHHTETGANEFGDDGWRREKKARAILCEEIKHELLKRWPGRTAVENKAKAEALEAHFKTGSWKAIEGMGSEDLSTGLEFLREMEVSE